MNERQEILLAKIELNTRYIVYGLILIVTTLIILL
jgi:hypothetical protein